MKNLIGRFNLLTVSSSCVFIINPPSPSIVIVLLLLDAMHPPIAEEIPKPIAPNPSLLKILTPFFILIACIVTSLQAPELPGINKSLFEEKSESFSTKAYMLTPSLYLKYSGKITGNFFFSFMHLSNQSFFLLE